MALMLKITPENTIIDIPDLNRFRIGDHVIADACAAFDRHEGIVVGIELQRLHGSSYLAPSITLLHGGYLTDGFKPGDLRKVEASEPAASSQHAFVPHPKYPWFCRDCGYAPHEALKHKQPGDRAAPTEPNGA
ncbi:hypothetical protein IB238_05465 [Rhizobium sp. ARZ01]|uniref:hypothetical protein n=1 Tax=Rhizobium sp. ARZ01 TaxID=2769313 RepID=UPI00177F6A25|nr:hypothetical protein [Rhizobium sp. ARZ01]MBD9372077.1 hypothetical protein [Rhizobium sp. ARZ01]